MATEHSIATSCEEAKALGLKWYFTGVPCKYGHVADRLVSNNGCRECCNAKCRDWRTRDKDYFRKWNSENKDKTRVSQEKYRRRLGVKPQVRHGQCETRLYRIWDSMKRRATGKYVKQCYAGVQVCDEWSTWEPFAAWARANGYRDNLIIDRIDGSRGYEPANCRWVTYTVSNRNRRNVKFTMEIVRDIRARYAAGGIFQRELAAECGVNASYISAICSGHRWREEE
jgi:hypothetical protein